MRVFLFGSYGTGKTSLVSRYCYNTFNFDRFSTISASFNEKTIVSNDESIDIQFWDDNGGSQYRNTIPLAYRNTDGFIFVFDTSKADTLTELEFYYNEFLKYKSNLSENPPILVLGNKCDLGNCDEIESAMSRWCDLHKIHHKAIVSAKDNTNVYESIDTFIKEIYETYDLKCKNNSSLKHDSDQHSLC